MPHETVICERLGSIGKLTFNRPEVLNVCNQALASELKQKFNDLAEDASVRVIVLTGAGKAFMAGVDVHVISQWPKLGDTAKIRAELAEMLDPNMLEDCPKPTIAAINGLALGLGCEVAAACDFRIMATTARIGLPEVKLGVVPGGGGSQRMLHLIGATRALELISTGDPMDAQEAYRVGFVNQVVPPEQLGEATECFAARLSDKSPVALKFCKRLIYEGGDLPLRQGLEYEKDRFCEILLTEDAAEGTAAFVEKRKPAFKGR